MQELFVAAHTVFTTDLIPAVGYVRMSSDRQEASPAQQRTEIENLADGQYEIVGWYEDLGISGAEFDKRPPDRAD